MFTTQNYIVASALDEAYECNQKPKSTVLGGCGWLKMGQRVMSNAEVLLYQGGMVRLSDFVHMPYDRDILTAIRLPKYGQRAVYLSHRAAATDFPVLAVAVCETAEQRVAAVGARPMRAERVVGEIDEAAQAFAERCAEELTFSSNLRGSAEYRTHLCRVLVRRAVQALKEV